MSAGCDAARRAAVMSDLLRTLSGRPAELLPFEDVRDELERTVDALEALVRLQNEGVGTSRRAARLAMDLGRRMGLTRRQILALQYACMIHDVGMTTLDSGIVRSKFDVPYGAELLVKHGDKVVEGQGLFQWDPYSDPILSKVKGKVEISGREFELAAWPRTRRRTTDIGAKRRIATSVLVSAVRPGQPSRRTWRTR